MELLTEEMGPIVLRLDESSGKQSWLGEGIFGIVDAPTGNKRIYPRAAMVREIRALQEKIKRGQLYGELDHPADGSTSGHRVAVLVTEIQEPDAKGIIRGKLKVMPNTTAGAQLAGILMDGGTVGVSSRAMGSVSPGANGNLIVAESDLRLITWDAVLNPSVSIALPDFKVESGPAAVSPPVESELPQAGNLTEATLTEEIVADRVSRAIELHESTLKAEFTQTLMEAMATLAPPEVSPEERALVERLRGFARNVAVDLDAVVLEMQAHHADDIEDLNRQLALAEARNRELLGRVVAAESERDSYGLAMVSEAKLSGYTNYDRARILKCLGDAGRFTTVTGLTEAMDAIIEALGAVTYDVLVERLNEAQARDGSGAQEQIAKLSAALEESQGQTSAWRSKCIAANASLSTATDEKAALAGRLAEAQTRLARLDEAQGEVSDEVSALRDQVSDLTRVNEALRLQLDNRQRDIDAAEAEAQRLREALTSPNPARTAALTEGLEPAARARVLAAAPPLDNVDLRTRLRGVPILIEETAPPRHSGGEASDIDANAMRRRMNQMRA